MLYQDNAKYYPECNVTHRLDNIVHLHVSNAELTETIWALSGYRILPIIILMYNACTLEHGRASNYPNIMITIATKRFAVRKCETVLVDLHFGRMLVELFKEERRKTKIKNLHVVVETTGRNDPLN